MRLKFFGEFILNTNRSYKQIVCSAYHPTHVFRGIVISEANRLKKLNEKTEDYKKALINLKIKCSRSSFSKKLIHNTFNELDEVCNKDPNTNNIKNQNKVKK